MYKDGGSMKLEKNIYDDCQFIQLFNEADREIENTVNRMSDTKVRECLIYLLKNKKKEGQYLNRMLEKEGHVKQLYRKFDCVIRKYGGQYAYIEYHDIDDFTEDVINYLYKYVQPLTNQNSVAAFELLKYVYKQIVGMINDFDEQLIEFETVCKDLWQEILDCTDNNQYMFNWLECYTELEFDYKF